MAALQSQLAKAILQHPPHQQAGLQGRAAPHSPDLGLLGDGSGALPAPSAFIVQELRKALAAGWADQVWFKSNCTALNRKHWNASVCT